MVRILHLGKFAPPAVGGMESFLAALMDRQARAGHLVHAVRLAAAGFSRASDGPAGGPAEYGALLSNEYAPRVPDGPAGDPEAPNECPAASRALPRLSTLQDDDLHRPRQRTAPDEAPCPGDPAPRFLDVRAVWAAGPAPFAPGYRAAVRDLVRGVRPDVVHAHLPNLSALWSLPEASIPLVVHWHADVPRQALPLLARTAWPVYRLLLDRVLARAARIVCTSKAGRDASPDLRKHRDKCVVVPLGLELGQGHGPDSARSQARDGPASRDPMEPPNGSVTVLGLGRFASYKGFDVLVRAAALTPPRVRFVLAGEGPLLGSTRGLAARLGLEGRVTFPGRVSDARRDRLLAECDIFCLPAVNRAEAFGLVALEAMACARPVTACSPPGSGVAEVVDHGTTGLLVPPCDPRALARALTRLADSPDERVRMGLAGRSRLAERFDLARVALALEDVYQQAGR